MKKFLVFVAAMVATVALSSAQDFTIGARGAFATGFGTDVAKEDKGLYGDFDYSDTEVDLDLAKTMNFGGAIFAKIGITDTVSVQPEIGFTYHKIGIKFDKYAKEARVEDSQLVSITTADVSEKGIVSFTTIDIPVLIGYDIEVSDGFILTPFAGPQLSLIVGKEKASGDFLLGDDFKFSSPFLFDLVFGANVAFDVGPGAIVADIRYNFGLTPLYQKLGSFGQCWEFGTPRALGVSLGYQMKIGE